VKVKRLVVPALGKQRRICDSRRNSRVCRINPEGSEMLVPGGRAMKEDGKKDIRRITDSDFAHLDGVWPDSQTFIEEQLGHLSR
jgi:hypothetical protein